MSANGVQLYSSWFCPFAQRAWIALLEKGVDFVYKEIDPYKKSKEHLAVNPRGLVPVIVNGNECVYESPVCIEYVDETWPQGAPLMPKSSYERARVRIWSDFVSKKIVPKFYRALQYQTKEDQETAMSDMLNALEELCRAMSSEGPYFSGRDFGMVDIMLVPYSIRFHVLKHFRGFSVPESFSRFHQWQRACESRESVIATVATLDRYIQIYERYANNTAQSEVAEAVRKGTILP